MWPYLQLLLIWMKGVPDIAIYFSIKASPVLLQFFIVYDIECFMKPFLQYRRKLCKRGAKSHHGAAISCHLFCSYTRLPPFTLLQPLTKDPRRYLHLTQRTRHSVQPLVTLPPQKSAPGCCCGTKGAPKRKPTRVATRETHTRRCL